MLKLRLKRIGRKKAPFYRIVLMEHGTRRDGRPIDTIGWYDPISKNYEFHHRKTIKWLEAGVKPTKRVFSLLEKAEIIMD